MVNEEGQRPPINQEVLHYLRLKRA
jgi:hypothetical protein